MRIIESYLDIPQGKIFVHQWIPSNTEHLSPLILLHDSLGSVELWREFPEQLAFTLNRPVIAYDRLGFGKSSGRDTLPSVEFISEEAEFYFPLLCDELGLSGFFICGHSVGGAMALLIAATHKQCKGVISLSAQVFVEEGTLEGIRAAKKAFQNLGQFNKLKKWHDGKSEWVLSAWTEVWLSDEFAGWNIVQNLKKVTCPVLVIHGESDEYGSVAFPETIKESVKGKVQMEVLNDCGHVPHREKNAHVLETTLNYFRRVAG